MRKLNVICLMLVFCVALSGVMLAQDKLEVKQMVLCKKIENKDPVDVAEKFTVSDQNVYCFVAIANPGEETTVTFKWFFNGKEHYKMDNKIGHSTNWRTRSSVTARAGEWTVQLFQGETMLKEIAFQVEK